MDVDNFIPIIAIVATAVIVLALIRVWRDRLTGRAAQTGATIAGAEENARLAHENETLRLTIRRLEERMGVLERIATDPAERTAREIEQLR